MNLSLPLVSVIVPNYNHEKYLKQRLDSIFNQTYSNFEVILLDDCSTDQSRVILSQCAKNTKVTHCVFNEMNSGNTFSQWEKGIRLSKGDYIWIAESDDTCSPNFLEELIKPLINDTEVVLSYCQSNRVNENGEITGNWITHTDDLEASLFQNDFVMDGNLFIEKFLIFKNVIPNASAAIFRKLSLNFEEHLKLSKNFRTCGDWLFYINFLLNNKVAFIAESLNNFRYHSSSVIANTVNNESLIAIIDIDIDMRNKIRKSFANKEVSNLSQIVTNNNSVKKNDIYKKALLLIKRGQKVKGYSTLLMVLDLYLKNINWEKKRRNCFFSFFKVV
ncbi:glycosyltransferase family A protein [Flavobacterium luminosum]|uniref:Glycosyltransferase family 2 protein n=1 Tax=Flavobacterium luminosum TaxID=2949086 RepID=A0ABT0TNM9_9FLAO|nr:glycosyltransferase family 2 protein [Flavobacterium sp. HXWNR70]MCL9809096.1 glycosyltransferase family 2 protein [Flavobacterium sp. HXWNR70]